MSGFDPQKAKKLLLSDTQDLLNIFTQLTNSYKLLVGAAEEFTQIPGAGQATVNRAIDRADNTGTLIDFVILTLALKLDFVLEVLSATAVPLDLILEVIKQLTEEPRDPNNLIPGPGMRLKARLIKDQAISAGDEGDKNDREATGVSENPGMRGAKSACGVRLKEQWFEREQKWRGRNQQYFRYNHPCQ